MSAIVKPSDSDSLDSVAGPVDLQRHRFSPDEYLRILDEDILGEGLRIELIGGDIVPMSDFDCPQAGEDRWRFSPDDFFSIYESELLGSEPRIELIDGDIVHMTPVHWRHFSILGRIIESIPAQIGRENGKFLTDASIDFKKKGVLMPDGFIVQKLRSHKKLFDPEVVPVLWVMEISDTSLRKDREKAQAYAAANISEYWIINLNEDNVIVHRNPNAAKARYDSVQIISNGRLTIEKLPHVTVELAELFAPFDED
ncbi:hypothetical protein BH09SUM1_BH09SUM1_29850 [soil metagenome]